jgi:hypothetical protein
LLGQEKPTLAEDLLLQAYEGVSPSAKDRLGRHLVSLYEAMGKPEKAAEWRAKLPKPAAPAPVK